MTTPVQKLQRPTGGWTKKALAALGVPWPPPKGWKKRLEKGAALDTNYTDTWTVRDEQLAAGGFRSYEEYLQSDTWKEIKARAMRKKHFQRCYLCGGRNQIDLHHTSYKWICAGPKHNLRNIRALCRTHHQEVHDLARSSGVSVRVATTTVIKAWIDAGKLLAWQVRESKTKPLPPMNQTPPDPQHLHQLYCNLTGFPLRWDASRRYPWELFSLRFNEADLRLVIKWIQGRQRLGKSARTLLFRNFIAGPCSLDEFEEDMCQARAESRTIRVNPGKAQVLRATGRPVTTVGAEPVRAGDALERTKLAAQLAEWKKTL